MLNKGQQDWAPEGTAVQGQVECNYIGYQKCPARHNEGAAERKQDEDIPHEEGQQAESEIV
jgi:hypothetical protein